MACSWLSDGSFDVSSQRRGRELREGRFPPELSPDDPMEVGGRVTVVLPAFNEAENIAALVARLDAALEALDRPHRILVVDDGSTDGTAEAARRAGDGTNLDVVEHVENRGLGAALSTGLMEASGDSDVVVTMDADNSHDPAVIQRMVQRIEDGVDIVIASRFRPGASTTGVPWYRKLLSLGARGCVGLLARIRGVRDYSSGYRAYRAAALRRAIELHGRTGLVEEKGFACMLEILIKLSAQGARVTEVPLALRYDRKRGESKMPVARTVVRYAAVLSRRRDWDARIRPSDPGESLSMLDHARHASCRILNLGLAVLGLLLAAPLMLLIAAAVKVRLGGSILVETTRIGLNRRDESPLDKDRRRRRNYGGRPFAMYKFRTMPPTGQDPERQLRSPPDAPGIPPLGRLLRRYRLDELPQLLNVLTGDMNVVGPRPRAPEIARVRNEATTRFWLRNRVRPGITGWAQVHPHEQASRDDSLRDLPLDLEYVGRRSPLRDLAIVLKTFPVMVTGRGAW